MPIGPGKYDDLCTYVRETAKAESVVVLVFHGESGDGFSVQATPGVIMSLPGILRNCAQQIEDSLKAGKV